MHLIIQDMLDLHFHWSQCFFVSKLYSEHKLVHRGNADKTTVFAIFVFPYMRNHRNVYDS